MNATRAARRWFRVRASRAPQATQRLLYIAVTLLCAVVFAGFFMIGREGKKATEPAPASASIPIQSLQVAVPLRLGSAPPIETIARVHVREAPPAVAAATQPSSAVVTGESPASSPEASQSPLAPAAGPSSPSQTGGKTKVRSSGGVPFESSG
jgi:hypothetical protein